MSEVPPSNPDKRPRIDDDFFKRFHAEDQKGMVSLGGFRWEYKNPEWVLNKWKKQLEAIDDLLLSEEELNNKGHMLWLWYHHASQVAYSDGDIQTALAFIDKALEYREKIQLYDNQITPLLKLLYLGDFEGAKEFAKTIPECVMETNAGGIQEEVPNVEKETATLLINEYEKDKTYKEKSK